MGRAARATGEVAREALDRHGLFLSYVAALGPNPGADQLDGMLGQARRLVPSTPDGRAARRAAGDVARARADLAAAYLSSLDRLALDTFRRHSRGRSGASLDVGAAAMLGRAWDMIDGSRTDGAPLAAALREEPEFARSLLSEAVRDPAAFRADVAGGDLGAIVSRHCEGAHGMPRPWARAAHPLRIALGRDGNARAWVDQAFAWPLGKDDVDVCVDVTGMLGHMPGDWVPRGDAEWDAFAAMLPLTLRAGHMTRGRPEAMTRLVNAGGRWVEFARRIDSTCRGRGLDGLLRGADDVADAFARQVLQPARAIADGSPPHFAAPSGKEVRRGRAGALLHSGRSMRRILECSDLWHRDLHLIAEGIGRLRAPPAPAEGWRAGLPDHAMGALSLKVLTDERQLASEGAKGRDADGVPGLGHCAGGYGRRCGSGGYRIASVRRTSRDGSWRRSSTVGFACDTSGGKTKVSVHQHLGRGNSEPSPADVAFVLNYVAAVNAGRLPVDAAALRPVAAPGTVMQAAGYDWTIPGAWEAVRDLWRPHMPPALRDAMPEDMDALVRQLDGMPDVGWLPEPVSLPRLPTEVPAAPRPS